MADGSNPFNICMTMLEGRMEALEGDPSRVERGHDFTWGWVNSWVMIDVRFGKMNIHMPLTLVFTRVAGFVMCIFNQRTGMMIPDDEIFGR